LCECSSENSESFKFGHGGARIGAGRPRNVPRAAVDVERWYVARCHHQQINVADRAVREAGFPIFAPTIFRPARPARRDSTGAMRPTRPARVDFLLVRYLLVRLNLSDPSWRVILGCDGIERVISGGYIDGRPGVPIAVPDSAIDWMKTLLSPDGCLYPPGHHGQKFDAGTILRMPDGPIADRAGVCAMSDGARVVMMMGWFNRDGVPTTVRQDSVEQV
jgi:transcription antitermination factor NusG